VTRCTCNYTFEWAVAASGYAYIIGLSIHIWKWQNCAVSTKTTQSQSRQWVSGSWWVMGQMGQHTWMGHVGQYRKIL